MNFGLAEAIGWIEGLMLGSVATVLATVSVACVGLLLLDGRLDWKRGVRTVLGCFLIFGAPTLAAGIMGPTTSTSSASVYPAAESNVIAPPPRPPENYNPYSRAALPPDW